MAVAANVIKAVVDDAKIVLSNAFRYRCERYLRALTGDYSNVLKFQQGNVSTNGKIVYADPLTPDLVPLSLTDKIMGTRGQIAHEAFHILYTDFETLKHLQKKYGKTWRYMVSKDYLNIVEDSAIELAGCSEFPGVAPYIRFINDLAWNRMPSLLKMEKTMSRLEAHQWACAQYAILGKVKGEFKDKTLKKLFKQSQPFLDAGRVARDTWERMKNSEAVVALVEPLIEEAAQQGKAQQFQNPKGVDMQEGAQGQGRTMPVTTKEWRKSDKKDEKGKKEDKDSKSSKSKDKKDKEKTDSEDEKSKSSAANGDEEDVDSKDEDGEEGQSSGKGQQEDESEEDSQQGSGSSTDKESDEDDDESNGSGSGKSEDEESDEEDSDDDANGSGLGADDDESDEDSDEDASGSDSNGESDDDSDGDASGDADGDGDDSDSDGDPDQQPDKNGDRDPDNADRAENDDTVTPDDTEDEDPVDQEEKDLLEELNKEIQEVLTDMEKEEISKSQAEKRAERVREHLRTKVKYSHLHAGVKVRQVYSGFQSGAYLNYQDVLAPIAGITRSLTKNIQNMIRYNLEEKRTGQTSGRLNQSQLWRKDHKVFYQRKDKNDEADLCVLMQVDESGSMLTGQRYFYAMQACIMMAEVCEKLKIPFAVIGHNAISRQFEVEHFHYVTFEKPISEQKENLVKISHRHNTREGVTLRYSAEYLLQQPQKDKLLFVISDGAPEHSCAGHSLGGVPARVDAALVVEEYEKKGVTTIGVAIGGGQDYIAEMYKNYLSVENLEALPKKLVALLQKSIFKN